MQGSQMPVCGTPLASQGLLSHVYDENNGTTFLKLLLYKIEDRALVPDTAQDFTIGTGTLVSIIGPFDGMDRFSPNVVIIWFILLSHGSFTETFLVIRKEMYKILRLCLSPCLRARSQHKFPPSVTGG